MLSQQLLTKENQSLLAANAARNAKKKQKGTPSKRQIRHDSTLSAQALLTLVKGPQSASVESG